MTYPLSNDSVSVVLDFVLSFFSSRAFNWCSRRVTRGDPDLSTTTPMSLLVLSESNFLILYFTTSKTLLWHHLYEVWDTLYWRHGKICMVYNHKTICMLFYYTSGWYLNLFWSSVNLIRYNVQENFNKRVTLIYYLGINRFQSN